MALKNVERRTYSFPKTTILKFEMSIPKNKRSKFLADLIEKNVQRKEAVSLEEVHQFWANLRKNSKRKTNKTAVELIREDRLSH